MRVWGRKGGENKIMERDYKEKRIYTRGVMAIE